MHYIRVQQGMIFTLRTDLTAEETDQHICGFNKNNSVHHFDVYRVYYYFIRKKRPHSTIYNTICSEEN